MYKISSYWYHTTNAVLLGLIGESSVFLSVFSHSIKTIFLFSLLTKPQYFVFTHYTSPLKLSLIVLFSLIRAFSVLYCCHQFLHFYRKSRYVTPELSHLTLSLDLYQKLTTIVSVASSHISTACITLLVFQ